MNSDIKSLKSQIAKFKLKTEVQTLEQWLHVLQNEFEKEVESQKILISDLKK